MRSIIQHLRFPFSLLLLPVFLMAYLMAYPFSLEQNGNAILLFIILHLLVYPSSNAYNSLQDQDKNSIGLVKNPLPAHQNIFWVSIVLDALAIALALLISFQCSIYISIYILASRLYSYRKIRLKKYPIIGFLIVFFFQGFWIYILTIDALGSPLISNLGKHLFIASSASCLIGAIYPLSQIYQHKSDLKDGVKTISYFLGKKGSFIFSGILFLIGSFLFCYPILRINDTLTPLCYLLFQLPSLIFFNYWFYKVIKNEAEANFSNTMKMNLISALCLNLFFILLIIWN